jgi:threonyl-tRNA synthetase
METAMTQFLEWLENSSNVKDDILNWETVKENALEKEKEQIIDAYWASYKEGQYSGDKTAEEYYNQTYNQKIPKLLYKDGTPMRKVKLGKETQELLDEVHNEKKGDLVRLLRWVLKHYSTGTDIDGFFMWENPIGEEFDSIQVVDHYLKENK